jgi:hypothetical protein
MSRRATMSTALSAALLLAVGCAPRPIVCDAPGACGVASACVALRCVADGGSPVSDKSRRFVRDATDVAFLERGGSVRTGELPATVVLGKAGDGPAAVLFRFDMPRDVEVQEAYLLVERADDGATDGAGVGLHAERVIGPWDARTVTWLNGPELRDDRAPSLILRQGAPRLLRIDVTSLVKAHPGEPPDQGLALVADRESPTGVTLATVPDMTSPLVGDPHVDEGSRLHAPRLDLYVK